MKVVHGDEIFAANNCDGNNQWQPYKFEGIKSECKKLTGGNIKQEILNHFGNEIGGNRSPYAKIFYQYDGNKNLKNSSCQVHFGKNTCLFE